MRAPLVFIAGVTDSNTPTHDGLLRMSQRGGKTRATLEWLRASRDINTLHDTSPRPVTVGMPVHYAGRVVGRVESVSMHSDGDGGVTWAYTWRMFEDLGMPAPEAKPKRPRRGETRRSRQARGERARSLRRVEARIARSQQPKPLTIKPGDVLGVRDGATTTTVQVIDETDGLLTLDRAVRS